MVIVVVFESLPHSLLIAKRHAHEFDKTSTEYLKDYLSHRKLKMKMNKTFSNWTNILHGVPQGSILNPLIFNSLGARYGFIQSIFYKRFDLFNL